MRIAIIGLGAMGSVYAGLLASAGNEVLAVHRDARVVTLVRKHGLRLQGFSGGRALVIEALNEVPRKEVDLVILAVKAAQADIAAKEARPLLNGGAVVLGIQNGLGSADAIATVLGDDRLIIGIAAGFGASLIGPGHVHNHGMDLVRIGPYSRINMKIVENIAVV